MTSSHELGPLEMQVLGLLDAVEPSTVTDVQARLAAMGSDLAYTTVMTVLTRLHKKGLAARRKEGNRYLYLASRRSPGVSEGILTRVHRALFQGDKTRPILALIDDDDLSTDELRALRKAIDERLKGGEEMSLALDLSFNLMVNAVGSFAIGAGVAWVGAKALRIEDGRWAQIFLALPLVKVAFDMVRGVPSDAFFWQKVDGATQELGSFRLGLGVASGIPKIDFALGALSRGITWSQSMAEPLATALSRRVGVHAVSSIAASILGVSLLLITLRITRSIHSLVRASRLRRSGHIIERRSLGRRTVDIVVSPAETEGPFAAGLFRPFVCIPGRTFEALSHDEREAVIGHEIGHIVHHDLVLFAALGLFADLFWFIPGMRSRCRKIRAQAEIAADRTSVESGADPMSLASALVRVAELSLVTSPQSLSLTRPGHEGSLLSYRVRSLLSPVQQRATKPLLLAVRWLGAAWTIAIVLTATALGNH